MSTISSNYDYGDKANNFYSTSSASSSAESDKNNSSTTETKGSKDFSGVSLSGLMNSKATSSLSNSDISYLSNIKSSAAALQTSYQNLLKAADGEDEESKVSATKSFVEAYNKLLSDANGKDNAGATKLANQLKATMETYELSLSEIGISKESDGKLTVDEDALKAAASDGSLNRFLSSNVGEFDNYGFANRLNLLASRVSNDPMQYFKEETTNTKKSAGDLGMSDFSHNQLRQIINYDSVGMLFDSMS